MKMGIMQPYFFPYLGYFSLILLVDKWIVFDVTQYTPKSWMNRNRILHPKSGWQYVTVPLGNSSRTIKTFQAKVLNMNDARSSIIGKLSHYKKHAPHFLRVNEIIHEVFDEAIDDSLVSLNVTALKIVCDYLGLQFSYQIASELELSYPPDLGPGDWAPYICHTLNASEYINPIGGKELFNASIFSDLNIDLYFADPNLFKYIVAPYRFEPYLSILDVMMWNAPESILAALNDSVKLVKAFP